MAVEARPGQFARGGNEQTSADANNGIDGQHPRHCDRCTNRRRRSKQKKKEETNQSEEVGERERRGG